MSSKKEWTFRIEHILDAVNKIQRYTAGMSLETFSESDITVDAVIRNFQIIGEATRHIPDDIQTDHTEIPWSFMQGMRHILVHDYDGIRLDIVWDTIQDNLPELIDPLKRMLEAEQAE